MHFSKTVFLLVSRALSSTIVRADITSLNTVIQKLTKGNGWLALKNCFLVLCSWVVMMWCSSGKGLGSNQGPRGLQVDQDPGIKSTQNAWQWVVTTPWEPKVIPLYESVHERVYTDLLGKVHWVPKLSRKALYLLRGSTKALNSSNRLLSLLSVQDEWGLLKLYSRGKGKLAVHFL